MNPRHETNLNIDVLRLEGNGEPEPLLTTRFMERQGALAPDDRWLAYTSNEAGRHEVFVVPFPDASFKRQISTDGGAEPRWSGNGRELFYRNGNRVMAVAIETEPELNPGNPELLFEGPFGRGGFGTNYDVTADGDRFLMIRQEEGREQGELQIVLNWFEELERLAPTEN